MAVVRSLKESQPKYFYSYYGFVFPLILGEQLRDKGCELEAKVFETLNLQVECYIYCTVYLCSHFKHV